MTKQETQKLLILIESMWPNWNPKNRPVLVEAWNEAFQNIGYEEAYVALMHYFKHDTKGFAPVPGQLIGQISEKKVNAFAPDEGEAWSLVHEAIENGIYGSEMEFKRLPPLIQRAVGSAKEIQAWAMMESDSMEVVRSNFLRAYRIVRDRAVEDGRIPDPVPGIKQQFDLSYLLEEHRQGLSEEEKAEALAWWEEQHGTS